jgi:hypothetical protein
MPHDGIGHHHHHHHGHHHHGHHQGPAAIGHNGPDGADHLASHPHGHPLADAAARDDERQLIVDVFIDGFRAAEDKTSFLRMARIPFELDGGDGPSLKLVDVEITDGWQVGTASPGFASPELVYHPFPGAMVRSRTDMRFVYVSLAERRDVPLVEMLAMIGD